MISEEIRELIKEERIKQGKTREELAEEAHVSVRLIEYWESGKRKATNIETLDKVLRALGKEWIIGHKREECSDEKSDGKVAIPLFSANAHHKEEVV